MVLAYFVLHGKLYFLLVAELIVSWVRIYNSINMVCPPVRGKQSTSFSELIISHKDSQNMIQLYFIHPHISVHFLQITCAIYPA